jgi:hypothetical protein
VPKGQVSWPVPLPSTAPCSSLLSTASSSSLLSPSLSIVVPVVSPQASAPPEVTPLPIAPLFPSFVPTSEHFRDVNPVVLASFQISSFYPSFSSCSSLVDILSLPADDYSLNLSAASAAAQVALAQGRGLDHDLIATHWTSIIEDGLLPFLEAASARNAHKCLRPQPDDSPLLRSIITGGAHILLSPDFSPNFGNHPPFYPSSFAPPDAIAIHYADLQRSGRGIILPLSDLQSVCLSGNLPLNVSLPFLVPKPGDPLGRLVSNYSSPPLSNLNHPSKKVSLPAIFGSIVLPQFGDVCSIFLNALEAFPQDNIVGYKADVKSAHNRVRIWPPHTLLCVLAFRVANVTFAFIPLEMPFGLQDSVFTWDLAARSLRSRASTRLASFSRAPLSGVYVDDFYGAATQSVAAAEIAALSSDCEASVGTQAINPSKTVIDPIVPILGWRWDCVRRTVTVSESFFRKLLILFFSDTPPSPIVGEPVPLLLLQRLGSYAIRAANCFTSLSVFSRGFHRALANLSGAHPVWTYRACSDLAVWQAFLLRALSDSSLLTLPWSSCGLLQYRLCDGNPLIRVRDRSERQRASAGLIAYCDACTTRNGLGFYIPACSWGSASLSCLQSYLSADGTVVPVNINVLEFAGCVWAAMAATDAIQSSPTSYCNRHIHILCDNTSCVFWVLKHRAEHPIHLFLLYVFALLQIYHRVVITLGYLEGKLNVHADAASRGFNCPEGSQIFEELQPLTKTQLSPVFERSLVRLSAAAFENISSILQEASTVSGLGLSPNSALATTWPWILPAHSPQRNMLFSSPLPSDCDLSQVIPLMDI